MNSNISAGLNSNKAFSHLIPLGWNETFQAYYASLTVKQGVPARVSGVRKNSFLVTDGTREWLTTVSGSLWYRSDALYPAAGDWVLVTDSVINDVFPRTNVLSRGASGGRGTIDGGAAQEQIIAANLDTVFIVCGLDHDFNLRRIERYMTLIYNCGLSPVVVLTKADQHEAPEEFVHQVESVTFGVPVHLVGFETETGLHELYPYLSAGKTVTMIGSSGAGKSTLLNRLAGNDIQLTGAISDSVGKGKHTTTARDLIMLPEGGMVIDNPGIREIAFWDSGDGVQSAFPEIEEHATGCRFADCTHTNEPGCQVLAAVSSGEIQEERLNSYHKMKRELDYVSQRQHKSADRIEKERWKDVALKGKAINKARKNR